MQRLHFTLSSPGRSIIATLPHVFFSSVHPPAAGTPLFGSGERTKNQDVSAPLDSATMRKPGVP